MRIYEDHSHSPDEWFVTSTLTLEDDGRFLYDELWTCYWGSAGGSARGRWRRDGARVALHPEETNGSTLLRLEAGRERSAVDAGDTIDFGDGVTLRLRPAPPAAT